MNTQSIIVPRQSTVPVHEARARAILRWLVREKVVEEQLTTCGRTGNRMAHALGPGARKVALHPDKLPFGAPVNGLEVMLKRCIYTPTEGFKEEAGCPQCRREVGEPLFDSLEEWMPGVSDNFTCPLCGVSKTTSMAFCSCNPVPFPTWASSSTTGAMPGSPRRSSTASPIGWTNRWRWCRSGSPDERPGRAVARRAATATCNFRLDLH